MEVNRDRKEAKFDLGLSFSKYALFLLNAIFAISSILMVSGGISTYATFESHYDDMGDGFRMLSIFWLVVGIVFMFVALFGIVVAFKESTVLATLYGIAMMLVFVAQVSAAIACFTLISRSRNMVSERLGTMMREYAYGHELELDWIQSKFECCGINGPSDWQNYDRFSTPDHYYETTTESYYYRTADTADYDEDYHYGTNADDTTTEPPRTDLMPASCCEISFSNYVNLTCEAYHKSGCFEPIHQILSKSIMIIGSSALILAVVQVLGVILGFVYARIVWRKKTQRDGQIWNIGQENSTTLRTPSAYANYSQLDNQGEVKYI